MKQRGFPMKLFRLADRVPVHEQAAYAHSQIEQEWRLK